MKQSGFGTTLVVVMFFWEFLGPSTVRAEPTPESIEDTMEMETVNYSQLVQVISPRKLTIKATPVSLSIVIIDQFTPPSGLYSEKTVFDFSPEPGAVASFRQVPGYVEIGLEKLKSTKIDEQILGCEPSEWKALARILDKDMPRYLKKFAAFGCVSFR
jgi:hypothetical protein